MRKIAFLVCFSICRLLVLAQNISFVASADAVQVPLGGYVEVTFTFQNGDLRRPELPKFEGFDVVSGPNTGRSIVIDNGVKTANETMYFTLQAKKLGTMKIAPARVTYNGKTYSTAPLTIEVLKGSVKKNDKEEMFLRAEVSKSETYIGGQITLDLKLYSNLAIAHIGELQAPDLKDFAYQDFEPNLPMAKEMYRGVQYQTAILKRYLLSPQKVGTFNLTPFGIKVMVAEGFDTGMRGVESNSLIINILALPEPSPNTFTGAVGVYELAAGISSNTATTDDALTLQLTISGEGDVKRIFAPKLNFGDSIEVFDPKQTGEILGNPSSKSFEYIITSKYAGQYKLKPQFTFFNIDTKQYETISTGDIILDITQSANKGNDNINPMIDNAIVKNSDYFDYVKYALGVVLLFGSIFWWWRNRSKNITNRQNIEQSQSVIEIKSDAPEQEKTLGTKEFILFAQKALDNNNHNDFYKYLSQAILAKATVALQITPNTPRGEIFRLLEKSPNQQGAARLKAILEICDKARYGGGIDTDAQAFLIEVKNMTL